MARLDWFREFADHLIERSLRHDWPPPGSEYWSDFEASLARVGVSWSQAEEALSIACDKPKLFPGDWRPTIVEAAREIKRRDEAAGLLGESANRNDLDREARDCRECGGSGTSLRFVHNPDHPTLPRGSRVLGYCGSCRLGRFMATGNRRPTWGDTLEMAYRPDLPQLHHPDDWDAEAGRPRVSEAAEEVARLMADRGVRNAPGGLVAALKARLAANLSSKPEDRPGGKPGPTYLPPPVPVERPAKVWRRDPPGTPAGPPASLSPRPSAGEPPKHREPPPF